MCIYVYLYNAMSENCYGASEVRSTSFFIKTTDFFLFFPAFVVFFFTSYVRAAASNQSSMRQANLSMQPHVPK